MAYRSGSEAIRYTDPVTGREVLQLTGAPERSVHGYYDLPPWSRQTGEIAFTAMAPGAGSGEVYTMGRDGSGITHRATTHYVSANDGAMAQWSADGRRVYYKDHRDGQDLIAWVEVASGETGAYPGDLRMVSPVGHLNVYHTNCARHPDHVVLRERGAHGLFVMDLDTGRSRQLASIAQCLEVHPRRDEVRDWHLYIKHTKWSPDGKRIMFVFTNEIRYAPKYAEEPRVKDIYVLEADGSGLHRVGEFGNHPLWHPNGRQILSNSPWEGRPGNSLVLSDADTGERTLAATSIAGSGHPSFSPDGRWIAMDHVLPGEGSASLNLVDVQADRVEHVLQLRVRDHSHVGTHLHPAWSWDGRQLLVASDATGLAQLCVIDV